MLPRQWRRDSGRSSIGSPRFLGWESEVSAEGADEKESSDAPLSSWSAILAIVDGRRAGDSDQRLGEKEKERKSAAHLQGLRIYRLRWENVQQPELSGD